MHAVGMFMLAFGLGGLVSGALGYRSGLRDGKARIARNLLERARREQQREQANR